MATPKKPRTTKPAMNPESREKQLIDLAVNLAEKQLREGTAPPSVVNHYLKLASQRETLEREMLTEQVKLITAKSQAIVRGKEMEDVAKQAIEAMRNYSPSGN